MPPVQIVPPLLEREAAMADHAPSRNAAAPSRNIVQALRLMGAATASTEVLKSSMPKLGYGSGFGTYPTDLGSHTGTVGSMITTGAPAGSFGAGTQNFQSLGAGPQLWRGIQPGGGAYVSGGLGHVGGWLYRIARSSRCTTSSRGQAPREAGAGVR